MVNLARGKIVDTGALLVEVSGGRLRAALDVTDPEPLPPDHPLWRAPGVIITPHVGGNTRATDPRLLRLLREQIARLQAGDNLLNVVARTERSKRLDLRGEGRFTPDCRRRSRSSTSCAEWSEIEVLIVTGVTNSRTEANTTINNIRRAGRGFRNLDSYRTHILMTSAAKSAA